MGHRLVHSPISTFLPFPSTPLFQTIILAATYAVATFPSRRRVCSGAACASHRDAPSPPPLSRRRAYFRRRLRIPLPRRPVAACPSRGRAVTSPPPLPAAAPSSAPPAHPAAATLRRRRKTRRRTCFGAARAHPRRDASSPPASPAAASSSRRLPSSPPRLPRRRLRLLPPRLFIAAARPAAAPASAPPAHPPPPRRLVAAYPSRGRAVTSQPPLPAAAPSSAPPAHPAAATLRRRRKTRRRACFGAARAHPLRDASSPPASPAAASSRRRLPFPPPRLPRRRLRLLPPRLLVAAARPAAATSRRRLHALVAATLRRRLRIPPPRPPVARASPRRDLLSAARASLRRNLLVAARASRHRDLPSPPAHPAAPTAPPTAATIATTQELQAAADATFLHDRREYLIRKAEHEVAVHHHDFTVAERANRLALLDEYNAAMADYLPKSIAWATADNRACTILLGALPDALMRRFQAREMRASLIWAELQAMFERRDISSVGALFQEYFSITLATCDGAVDYVGRMHEVADRLSARQAALPEPLQIHRLLYNLTPDYESRLHAFTEANPLAGLNDVVQWIINTEVKLRTPIVNLTTPQSSSSSSLNATQPRNQGGRSSGGGGRGAGGGGGGGRGGGGGGGGGRGGRGGGGGGSAGGTSAGGPSGAGGA
ncbi:unnamed protein product [Closterium sp. NIES-64]|nr:unnamed protein product [Closterium sp. NIES-64]